MVFSILEAQEIVIVADKNFSEQNLTKKQIQAIFLDKKRFMQGEQILVMNYEFEHPLRRCFEKTILEKTPRALEKYWRHAYYKGKRPPKIVSSEEMLFLYLESIQPSIGYVDGNGTFGKEVIILLKVECE